jgi:hypothetical protein
MKKITSSVLIGAAACTALVVAGAVPAYADTPAPTPHTLAAVQAAAAAKTGQRTTSLTAAIAKVTAATHLTSADKTTILGILNGDLAAMPTVAATVAADTTFAQATADYRTVYTGYRVYAVAIPQARYAAASDALTAGLPRLTTAQAKLAGLLSGKDAAKSTPALQADLADMTTKIATATTALSGLSARALAVTPSSYNADHSALSSIKPSLVSAQAALKQARQDAKTVVAAIR